MLSVLFSYCGAEYEKSDTQHYWGLAQQDFVSYGYAECHIFSLLRVMVYTRIKAVEDILTISITVRKPDTQQHKWDLAQQHYVSFIVMLSVRFSYCYAECYGVQKN